MLKEDLFFTQNVIVAEREINKHTSAFILNQHKYFCGCRESDQEVPREKGEGHHNETSRLYEETDT